MQKIYTLSLFLGLLFSTSLLSAQKMTDEKKAEEKLTELVTKISEAEAPGLSEAQKKSAYTIYLDAMVAMSEIRKMKLPSEETDEKLKPIRKEMSKKINMEVLTKEQRQAINASKKDE